VIPADQPGLLDYIIQRGDTGDFVTTDENVTAADPNAVQPRIKNVPLAGCRCVAQIVDIGVFQNEVPLIPPRQTPDNRVGTARIQNNVPPDQRIEGIDRLVHNGFLSANAENLDGPVASCDASAFG